MSVAETVAAVRRGAGLFRLEGRGLVVATGKDRSRWLDGRVSNDVASLAEGPERSGCYATLLTHLRVAVTRRDKESFDRFAQNLAELTGNAPRATRAAPRARVEQMRAAERAPVTTRETPYHAPWRFCSASNLEISPP